MGIRRRKRIEELLRRGGAINRVSGSYSAHHPSERFSVTEEEATELLNEGALVVVNCGCTGFWWALRPDLMATYSAALAQKES